jgi:cob(I)alamin adenosyltransferase
MIQRLEYIGGVLYVHTRETSMKTTKAFTHAGHSFDSDTGLASFGKLPSVQMPAGVPLKDGAVLNMQLVSPGGELKKQKRTVVLRKGGKDSNIFRVAGISRTPAQFSAEDGWQIEVIPFRAYFTHPGLQTTVGSTGDIPQWLKDSIKRQTEFWNRMAWICREARQKCTPAPVGKIKVFVQQTILPAIDTFNDSLGRSRQKLKHPAKLKGEMPGIDGLWKFVGQLRKRADKGRSNPDGLLESVISFAEQFKPDYTPMIEFQSSVLEIGEREAAALHLKRYEIRPVMQRFASVLKARKTRALAWTDGWPSIKYPDSPKAKDWSLTYYINKAGVKASGLEDGSGIPGLHFEIPKTAAETGHPNLIGSRAKRKLREAVIWVPSGNKEDWSSRFGVLQERELTENSHIKQWQLSYIDGRLWLGLTVELQRPVAVAGPTAAGLDIGWRRVEEGIRVGVLFRVNLGPSRWQKRNITCLIPDWKPGDAIPGTFELRSLLEKRRGHLMDKAKAELRRELGDAVPAWFDKAGKNGLLHLAEEMKDNAAVENIVNQLAIRDKELGRLISFSMEASTKRLEYGYQQIAHDVLKHLKAKGITRLVVEPDFLAKVAQEQPEDREGAEHYALKNSQKYRQFAGVKKFVTILVNIARKYGIIVDKLSAINTTRICQYCNHLNPATAKERFQCKGCERLIDQDRNAGVNLSRFAADPTIAEMAAKAGII